MDYDVSISIGTTANLGDLTKANKAVQDLAKAAKQVPDSLLSGGVGGTAAPAYTGAAHRRRHDLAAGGSGRADRGH